MFEHSVNGMGVYDIGLESLFRAPWVQRDIGIDGIILACLSLLQLVGLVWWFCVEEYLENLYSEALMHPSAGGGDAGGQGCSGGAMDDG